jgi:hypothetical protein
VVVFVDVDVDDLLHAPFVGQALGPKGVDAVNRALLRVRRGNAESDKARKYERDSKNSGRLIPHTHGGLSCSPFRRDFQLISAVAEKRRASIRFTVRKQPALGADSRTAVRGCQRRTANCESCIGSSEKRKEEI